MRRAIIKSFMLAPGTPLRYVQLHLELVTIVQKILWPTILFCCLHVYSNESLTFGLIGINANMCRALKFVAELHNCNIFKTSSVLFAVFVPYNCMPLNVLWITLYIVRSVVEDSSFDFLTSQETYHQSVFYV
jgi:hypothetical protein